MKFENMALEGSSNTAFEEAACRTSIGGWTDILLRHAGSIARALNAKRIESGEEFIAQRFVTNDNPEGFWIRVTSHEARWIIPSWARYDQFVDAEVNFCRTMDPDRIATRAV